jgi:hypothetical protein
MAKKLSMEFDFHEVDTKKLAEECDSRIKEFNKLLDQLPLAHVKKRMLWNQIFENALVDRRNAYIMSNNLYLDVHGNPDQHALHGQNLTKYLERMSKANEQIIKLSELISEAITDSGDEDEEWSEDDMYEKLQTASKGSDK